MSLELDRGRWKCLETGGGEWDAPTSLIFNFHTRWIIFTIKTYPRGMPDLDVIPTSYLSPKAKKALQ